MKCSRDYDGMGWVLYDRAFHRQVAVTKELNWSKLNPTLHSLCLAGKARRNKFAAVITMQRSNVQSLGKGVLQLAVWGLTGLPHHSLFSSRTYYRSSPSWVAICSSAYASLQAFQ